MRGAGRLVGSTAVVSESDAFVTIDRAILTGGVLDPIDIEVIGGRRVVTPDQMMAEARAHQPEERPDYQALATAVWPTEEDLADFERLTPASVRALGEQAGDTFSDLEALVRKRMSTGVALAVRRYRCERNYSWRSVASVMWQHGFARAWRPPPNQIAGMALCKVAAEWLGEDWLAEPWN